MVRVPSKEEFLEALARQRKRQELLKRAKALGDAAFAREIVRAREEADEDAKIIEAYLGREQR